MKKLILISGMFLCAGASFAQGTVTVDKNSSARTNSNVVEITAPAIPMDQKENYRIAPENYHKAVNVQDIVNENDKSVEITVGVQKYADQKNSSVKKEAIIKGNSNTKIPSEPNQKQVEIKAAATKQN